MKNVAMEMTFWGGVDGGTGENENEDDEELVKDDKGLRSTP